MLKKGYVALVLCLIALLGGAAYALELPEPVAQAFASDPAWDGWTAVAADADSLAGAPNYASTVVMERDGTYVLCLLQRSETGEGYVLSDMAIDVLYQDGRLPEIQVEPKTEEAPMFHSSAILLYKDEKGGYERYGWDFVEGQWCMGGTQMLRFKGDTVRHEVFISFFRMYLEYSENAGTSEQTSFMHQYQRFYGKINRMLRDFSITSLPKSILGDEASGVSTPERVRAGQQLDPLPLSTKATPDHPADTIFLGPGNSFPAREQPIGTDEPVELIGRYGSYVLCAYKNADSLYAYGYLPANLFDTLPDSLASVHFPCTIAYVQEEAALTDCPDGSDSLFTLRKGTQVIYLATLGGDWTLVEAQGTEGIVHGFVRSDALLVDYGMDQPMKGNNKGSSEAIAVRDIELIDDPYRRAEPTVLASLPQGTVMYFMDTLYGEWAYVDVEIDGKLIRGFVPESALASVNDHPLRSNG